MAEHRQLVDQRGRTWTISKVAWEEAAEEDLRFWYEGLTPEERVEAVGEALEGCLKTRGLDAVPRLRRVHRRIERHGVRYLVVGAHAVAFHARPRATKDLDILIEPTPANARKSQQLTKRSTRRPRKRRR